MLRFRGLSVGNRIHLQWQPIFFCCNGEGEPLCISPLLADSTVSCESGEGQRSNATRDHNINVADSTMVCNSVRNVSGGTNFDSSSIRPIIVPKRRTSSTNGNPKSLSQRHGRFQVMLASRGSFGRNSPTSLRAFQTTR